MATQVAEWLACKSHGHSDPPDRQFQKGMHKIRCLQEERSIRASQRNYPRVREIGIEHLFVRYGDASCTIPHDKIFALLGLITEKHSGFRLVFRPDYIAFKEDLLLQISRLGHQLQRPRLLALQMMQRMSMKLQFIVNTHSHLTAYLLFVGHGNLRNVLSEHFEPAFTGSFSQVDGVQLYSLDEYAKLHATSSQFWNTFDPLHYIYLCSPGNSAKRGDIYYSLTSNALSTRQLLQEHRGFILRQTEGHWELVGIVVDYLGSYPSIYHASSNFHRWLHILV